MSRDIPYSPTEKCDACGKIGAFDFMGDFLCDKCFNIKGELFCKSFDNFDTKNYHDNPINREHYHDLLDDCMDKTREGESFLPIFVRAIIDELMEKN